MRVLQSRFNSAYLKTQEAPHTFVNGASGYAYQASAQNGRMERFIPGMLNNLSQLPEVPNPSESSCQAILVPRQRTLKSVVCQPDVSSGMLDSIPRRDAQHRGGWRPHTKEGRQLKIRTAWLRGQEVQ